MSKRPLQELEGPRRLLLPRKDGTLNRPPQPAHNFLPKGEPLGLYMVGWKYPVHPDTPTMDHRYEAALEIKCYEG